MARILPAGANVNLNLGEDPMDKLTKMLQTVSQVQNIGQRFKAQQQKVEQEGLAALSVVTNLVGQSDDPSDIAYAEKIYNATGSTGSAGYNAAYQAVGKSISDANDSYAQIQSIGDEVGSIMTKNIELYDADGNITTNKRFSDLNKNEIIAYSNQLKSNDGANGEIVKQLIKVRQLRYSLGNRFGMTAEGKLKKIPNIKFKDNSGSDMSSSEFLVNLDRFENQMIMFVESSFPDSLNEQEAIMILNAHTDEDYKKYLKSRADKKEVLRVQAQNSNSNIKDANDKIKSIITATKEDDWTTALTNSKKLIETIMPDLLDPDTQLLYAEQFAGSPSLTDDVELNAKMIYNNMGVRTKAEVLEFYNKRKRTLVTQRTIDKEVAESWGFNFYGEPPSPKSFSGLQETDKDKEGLTFPQYQTKQQEKDIKQFVPKLAPLKEFNFDKPITSPEGEDISKGDQAGTTAIVSGVLKKFENVNSETNQALVEANNLYAIKFGDRAKKYGATDSGIVATDGGTFAKWGSVEEMEKNAPKIIAEMLNDDAKGDLKSFIGNYIGATKDNPKTDEINNRYNEIVKASTEIQKVDIKSKDKVFSPFEGKTINIEEEPVDEINNPRLLPVASKMFENYKSKTKRYVDKLEKDLTSKEKMLATINKNLTKVYSSQKQKEAKKNKLKIEKQIKVLKTKISNQKDSDKKINVGTYYNSIMTQLQKNRMIKIGAGDPTQREADEDYFKRGIATTKGIPDLDEEILEELYNELRPGSPLKRY